MRGKDGTVVLIERKDSDEKRNGSPAFLKNALSPHAFLVPSLAHDILHSQYFNNLFEPGSAIEIKWHSIVHFMLLQASITIIYGL